MALEGYASPHLRKSIFDRLHPGGIVEYEVIAIDEAFPRGHTAWEGDDGMGPTEAIRCTIVCPDGSYVVGLKEIELQEQGKDKRWRSVAQTPEQFTADCTKALGRALRDGGIPQKKTELDSLMRFTVALDAKTPPTPVASRGRRIDTETGEILGNVGPDDVDSPDAGSSDEPTPEQQVALDVSSLSGPNKAALSKRARDELGVTNLLRSGEHASAVSEMIRELTGFPVPDGDTEGF